MAKKESKETDPSPEDVMKSILTPITDALKVLEGGINSNSAAIKKLAKNPPKQEPILPKEVTKHIPALIQGIISALTQPDVDPAAARQGIFGETMQKAFETETIAQWKTNSKILEARFTEIDLENQLRKKRLSEEF